MKTLKIKYTGKESLLPAAEIIRSGGIVAFPTETVYGLGGNALDPQAAEKIYRAKGRPSDNPLIVHISSIEDAEKFAYTTPLFYKIADAYMPGPITVILEKRSNIPDSVTGGLSSVGLRIPHNVIARELIELAGVPVAAPSANISGRPSPTSFAHVEHDLDGRADALIDGGESRFGVESTIVKLDGDTLLLLRPGAITVDMLSLVCDSVIIDPSITEKFDGVPLAPGMKYRHYAPKIPMIMVSGEDPCVYNFLNSKERIGVICFNEDIGHINAEKVVSFGKKDDPIEQAHNLFNALRSFDNNDNIDTIYARMPSKDGVGLAVFNRMIKASGFNVVKI